MTTARDFARAVNPDFKDKVVCPGAGQEPRVIMQNDWFIGTKGVCAHCGRSFALTKAGKVARHKTR